MRNRSQSNRKLVVESVAFGLGYIAMLTWSGSAIPHLRSDTTGVIAFAVAIVSLVLSKYLQLRRRSETPAEAPAWRVAWFAGVSLVQAVAETTAVLGTTLVICGRGRARGWSG